MSPSPPSRGVLLQLNRSCRSLYKSLVQVKKVSKAAHPYRKSGRKGKYVFLLHSDMKTAVPSHAHEPVNAATLLGPTTTMPTEHGEGTRRGPITGQTRNTGQYWAILGDTGHTGRYCRYCGAASRAPGCVCRPPKPREQSPASGAQGGIVSHGRHGAANNAK